MQQNKLIKYLTYGALLFLAVSILFPIYWILNTSLKDVSSIFSYPPKFIPESITFNNYLSGFFGSRMLRYFFNSLKVSIAAIILTLIVATHAGYAAARYKFQGKKEVLFLLLSTSMVPGIAILVPLYIISAELGLYDKHITLILIYSTWQSPQVVWIMKSFFESIPKDMEEAALIDGCSPLGAFYRIALPMSQPGIAASAIIIFVYTWNEFLIAYTLISSTDQRLLTTGLYFTMTALGIDWGALTAATIMSLLPITILFFFMQKRFIQGLTSGATKG